MSNKQPVNNDANNDAALSPFQLGKGLPNAYEMAKRLLSADYESFDHMGLDSHNLFDFPKIDIADTGDALLLLADVPGVREEDLSVKVSENEITISGTRNRKDLFQTNSYLLCERQDEVFERYIPLLDRVEPQKISAQVKHGVLRLTLPKAQKAEMKDISITNEDNNDENV
jgi:HSP20 family protein